jgi:hypothetical protein
MKLSLKTLKPCNPFIAACLRRKSGAHLRSPGALRQRSRHELRRELDRLRPSP